MDVRKLEELKEKLMHELNMVSAKAQLTLADISMIDTLTHAIKNLCKILEQEEGGGSYGNGYSEKHYVRGHYSRDDGSYGNGGSYGNSYERGGNSYGGGSYRDMLEREYSGAVDPREKEVLRKMLDRL